MTGSLEIGRGAILHPLLDRLTSEEFNRLCRLNSNYREKFGFHFIFIYAVNGRFKYDVLAALECRLAGEPRGARQSAGPDLPDRAF